MPETALNALKTTLQENDLEGLRQLLQATPELANARPWQPRWHHTALESTAEVACGTGPRNTGCVAYLWSSVQNVICRQRHEQVYRPW